MFLQNWEFKSLIRNIFLKRSCDPFPCHLPRSVKKPQDRRLNSPSTTMQDPQGLIPLQEHPEAAQTYPHSTTCDS